MKQMAAIFGATMSIDKNLSSPYDAKSRRLRMDLRILM